MTTSERRPQPGPAVRLPEPELLATSWTSAGAVRPGRTGPTSPVPVLDRVRAVAEAGYSGIGLGLPDLVAADGSIGHSMLAREIRAAGIMHVEVEFLDDWWLDGDRRARSDEQRRGLLRAAESLGARHLKAGCGRFGDTRDHGRLLDELGALSDQAAAHGTRIALEPGAGSALDLTGEAIPLLTGLAHPAAGLMLDPWHLVRAGIPYDQALGSLRPELVVAVELSDGAAECRGMLFDDTFDRRLPPGEGDFDVPAFVAAVRRLGFSGPWGVEVMSDDTRAEPVDTVLTRCRAGALRCLAPHTSAGAAVSG